MSEQNTTDSLIEKLKLTPEQQKSGAFGKNPKCARCRNHGINILLKGLFHSLLFKLYLKC
jgi:hypothetical protein